MPSNPKKPGTSASQSFTKKEIDAACQMLDMGARGGDVAILMRTAPVRKLHAKFKRMSARLVEQTVEREPVSVWVERLQERVPGFEVYGPKDEQNPAPGSHTVVGPLSEYRCSSSSLGHAAMLYLAHIRRDQDAIEALGSR